MGEDRERYRRYEAGLLSVIELVTWRPNILDEMAANGEGFSGRRDPEWQALDEATRVAARNKRLAGFREELAFLRTHGVQAYQERQERKAAEALARLKNQLDVNGLIADEALARTRRRLGYPE